MDDQSEVPRTCKCTSLGKEGREEPVAGNLGLVFWFAYEMAFPTRQLHNAAERKKLIMGNNGVNTQNS